MIAKNQKKYIKSLQYKKYRNLHATFIVEGWKSIRDFLDSAYRLESIYSTKLIPKITADKFVLITPKELENISFFKHPKDALAVFKIKTQKTLPASGFTLVLDNIQDPGNLGAVIRTADWFGVKNIVCSLNTVDCYNPKVIQASMGSLAHVHVFYTDLENYLKNTSLPVYGAFMQGENIYQAEVPNEIILVMGNEGNGIRKKIARFIQYRLHIPAHQSSKTESLNVAAATSIILSQLRGK